MTCVTADDPRVRHPLLRALIALTAVAATALATVGTTHADELGGDVRRRLEYGARIPAVAYLAALEQGFTPTRIVMDAPFVIEQGPGLSEYLEGQVEDFVDVIYPLGKTVYGSFIPNGHPQEAGFQFSHKNLTQLEANLSPNYNFVLYGLTPIEHSYDSIAVGRTLDGVLLVLKPGQTRLGAARQAVAAPIPRLAPVITVETFGLLAHQAMESCASVQPAERTTHTVRGYELSSDGAGSYSASKVAAVMA